MVTVYNDFDREDLIDMVIDRDNYIENLESEIKSLKDDRSNKIREEFESNRKLVSNIFTNIVEESVSCDTN